MTVAILGGTGIYNLPRIDVSEKKVSNEYGDAVIYEGQGDYSDVIFMTRHGADHSTPPHKVNYRANMKALKDHGVKRIMATYAVGSITTKYQVLDIAVLRDFLDFTSGREFSFFDSIERGIGHVEMSVPYCPVMSAKILELAGSHNLKAHDGATYVATNGPRFESPAEIKFYQKMGGDVVGMTGCPEVYLAGELGMVMAAVALPINLAAGLEEKITIHEGNIDQVRENMVRLMLGVLKNTSDADCHPPKLL
ncbi:MAG: MTAP family purine nucleoside phosphorylase [Kordiimonadaceae bacterium]|jgi:5'-methylthioadenosine phosphorylase|nr:MTAP family purine nucleoside phosphorylase [Kordiimonadaceae bacterium]MBT6036890.1 MTAP family purine nucleoside phosphorylase [Kordiimonadaceae bacterium]MBT6328526.1 MTAP family purine nucleoside phosphorylase [Kordiimonadaceae bacterium]MBT7582958.1 MTAP family purine nucleoside phosphorylase [Kordiimonadaceae bacterium]